MVSYTAKPLYRCKLRGVRDSAEGYRLLVEMIDPHPRSKRGVGAVMLTSPVKTINFMRKFAITENSKYYF